jgi:hypothetical protein
MMTTTAPPRRPSRIARSAGYTVAAIINTALLYAVNVHPGWPAVPFLTDDTTQVLSLLNLSLAAGVLADLTYAVYDAPWWKGLGDLVTTALTLAVLVRLWTVFPFAFAGADLDWGQVVRVVLVVSMIGTAVAVVVQLVAAAVRLGHSAHGRPGALR